MTALYPPAWFVIVDAPPHLRDTRLRLPEHDATIGRGDRCDVVLRVDGLTLTVEPADLTSPKGA